MAEEFVLPTKRRKPKSIDSKRLLLFGPPKTGKTTILSELDECLIVDMEKGAGYVSGMIVEIENMTDYSKLIKALKVSKEANEGKVPYKYIVLDTLTALEDISLSLARTLYMQTAMGANYKGSDVRSLPNGAGYLYTRQAFFKMLKPFEAYCDTLIMVGHVKEKDLNKDGQDVNERSINLTGKTKDIICAWADTIGLVYREDNKTMINFEPSDSLIVGSRQKHLIGRKVCVATSDEKHDITVDWSSIFISEQAKVIESAERE